MKNRLINYSLQVSFMNTNLFLVFATQSTLTCAQMKSIKMRARLGFLGWPGVVSRLGIKRSFAKAVDGDWAEMGNGRGEETGLEKSEAKGEWATGSEVEKVEERQDTFYMNKKRS